jgi:heat shock protein HslJ
MNLTRCLASVYRTAHPVLAAAMVAAVFACAGAGEMGDGAIDSGRWTLASYDVDGRATSVPKEVRADARFENGRVAGSAGCNAYQGSYTRAGDAKLTVGPIAATQRFCEGPAASVEGAFLASLARAHSFSATSGRLIISDETGRALLDFVAAPQNPLVGSWQVTGYNNGAEAVVSVAIGTELTASFGADGILQGSSGCNDYSGSYVSNGETLSIGPLATTRKACAEPIMDQEARFLAALQAATGYRLEPHIIVLLLPDGAGGVILAP